MKKPRQIKIHTFTYKQPKHRVSSSSASGGTGNSTSTSIKASDIKRGIKLAKKTKKAITKAVKNYKKRQKAKERELKRLALEQKRQIREQKRLIREQQAKEKIRQRLEKQGMSADNIDKRVEKEYKVQQQIRRLKSNISSGLKSWAGDIEDYREKVEGYRDKLKGIKLSELDDKQLASLSRNVSNMANWAKKSTYEETLQKRAEGLVGYLGNDFEVVKKDESNQYFEIVSDNKSYTMTYKEVSDFWKMFRDLYDDVKALRDYEKGMAGVSTVFNLYQGRDIKDVDTLRELLQARYTLEQNEMLRRQEEATKDIRKGIKMLR